IALTAALGLLAACASSAPAATTLGPPNLTALGALTNIGAADIPYTYIQAVGLAPNLRATSPGVVVKWRIRSDSATGTARLRVVRPAGTSYTGAGVSDPLALTGAVAEAATRLPVTAGDYIGIDNSTSALIFGATTGAEVTYFQGTSPAGDKLGLPEGSTLAPTSTTANRQLAVQAVVEPDADGDGFGDETQDQCPGDPTAQAPPCATTTTTTTTSGTIPDFTPPNLTVTSRSRKGRLTLTVTSDEAATLRLSGTVALGRGRTAALKPRTALLSAGTPLALKVSAPKKAQGRRRKATLTLSASDAAGNLTTRTIKAKLGARPRRHR
ncbi:MAG: hypothetical protein LC713_06915, partial [Actinobacteria bacterium]|nr:hypothetical protein [Actinomycetota bacterium]